QTNFHVQNAFTCQGQAADIAVGSPEGITLDVLGYDVARLPPRAFLADINGDGKPDYVLYSGSTRQTAVWYLDNNVFIGGTYGKTLPAGWSLIDLADFDGDGHPDFALFNLNTRQTAIWYLSGATRLCTFQRRHAAIRQLVFIWSQCEQRAVWTEYCERLSIGWRG